jgi:hypothetical protein
VIQDLLAIYMLGAMVLLIGTLYEPKGKKYLSVVSFGVILFGSEGTHCPYRNIKYVYLPVT